MIRALAIISALAVTTTLALLQVVAGDDGATVSSFAVSTTAIEAPLAASEVEEWREKGCALEDCSYVIATPRPAIPAPIKPSPVAAAPPASTVPAASAPSKAASKATPKPPAPKMTPDDVWQRRGHVAHALGSPEDGTIYTNSAEAFEHSYDNGFRAFEVDLMLLKDGNVALVHNGFERRYGLEKKFRESTLAELKGALFDDRYPMLFGDDFVKLVASHPDSYFVLDTKFDDVTITKWLVSHMPPKSLDRLRPHVHSQAHIDAIKKLYDWKGMIIATYLWTPQAEVIERQTLELATANRIGTVMLRDDYYSDGMRDRLAARGVTRMWIHDVVTSKDITAWRKKGIGVYSHGFIAR